MELFVIKATKETPQLECTYYLEADDKDSAEKAFNELMPNYEVVKVKRAKKPEEEKTNESGTIEAPVE